MCSAAILSIAALSAAPALAQKKTVKTCQEEWRANKAANEAAKITEKDYVAKCRAESTTAKPAAAPPAAAPATTAAKPVTGKPKDARQAEYARERAENARSNRSKQKYLGRATKYDQRAKLAERVEKRVCNRAALNNIH